MRAKLILIDYDKYQLEIHSEDDVEAIALKAWSNIFFEQFNNKDDKDIDKALLVIVNNMNYGS